jgi:anti-anti-sigma regulatory factor
VGELHPQWLDWLTRSTQAGCDEARVDAHAVDQVDAAGLQLLVALQRSLAERGVRLHLHAPSATLLEAGAALGLLDRLGSPAPHTPEGALP